jgi:hypothetical protein
VSAAVEFSRRRGSRIVRPGSARARAWNEKVGEVVSANTPGELPFFCECGMDNCRSSVWLTLHEARGLIESCALIIAPHFFGALETRLSRPM